MEPVFTLPWPEYIVAQRIQSYLKKADGYSVYIPTSRQEKGVDLALLKRSNGEKKLNTFQVKASRTYPGIPAKRITTTRYNYYTWFNTFTPSVDADFFVLVGFFPTSPNQTSGKTASWYNEFLLLFDYQEMKDLLDKCLTVKGEKDKMFGFGFNDLTSIILTRGDQQRSSKEFKQHLLSNRIPMISK